MEKTIFRRQFVGSYLLEARDKGAFNKIVISLSCPTSYDLFDALKRAAFVVETERFSIPFWKLFLLQCQKDYMVNPSYSTYKKYVQEFSGFGGFRVDDQTQNGDWNIQSFTFYVENSEFFRLRVSDFNSGIYGYGGIPRDFSVSVGLFYSDSDEFSKRRITPRYVDIVQQGNNCERVFDKCENIHLIPTSLVSPWLHWIGSYSVYSTCTIDFGGGVVQLGEMFPSVWGDGISVDLNFLCGYFGCGERIVVTNCYLTHEPPAAYPIKDRAFEIWIV